VDGAKDKYKGGKMTNEEIIEMARQSGAMFDHMTWVERDLLCVFERFAELVEKKERHECARICAESGMWNLVHEIEGRGQK
jgi:hypothetical protein